MTFQKQFKLSFILGLLLTIASPGASLPSLRYTGVLRHHSIQRDQYVTLDLVANPQSEEPSSGLGLLKFYFGDLKSREYVSFHFDTAHLHGDWLVFDQINQEVSVSFPKFSEEELRGTLRTSFTTEHPELILRKDGKVALKYPLIDALWGEYEGVCEGKKEKLQLYTYRSIQETTKTGHPFSDYEIVGEIGVENPNQCTETDYCVRNLFFSGAYNFYTQNLDLFGRYENQRCLINESGMTCGSCQYKKTSSEDASVHPQLSATSPDFPKHSQVRIIDPQKLEGSYLGYVYHELLNEYQAADLDFFIVPPKTEGGPIGLSTLFRLYFGDFKSQEALTYRYDPVFLSGDSNHFVLAKPTLTEVNEMDAVLEITNANEDFIEGVWYSLLFGRVGTFYLQKSKPPQLSAEKITVGSLTGTYTFENLLINVGVAAEKIPANLENPFSPLNFVGRMIHTESFWPAKDFRGGSYDFYTGRIALFLDQKDRYLVGNRETANSIELRLSPFNLLSPLLPFEGNHFVKNNGSRSLIFKKSSSTP